jgi:hypothetical protein
MEEKLNAFHLLFNPILDKHAPIRRIKLRTLPNPFVTDKIKLLMRSRDNCRKLASKSNDPNAWSTYTNLKREVKYRLRKAEKDYVAERIKDNPNDSNYLWKIIRSCIPKKTTTGSAKSLVKDEKVIADDFNKYFCSIGKNIVKKINLMAEEFNYDLNQTNFSSITPPPYGRNFPPE